MNTPHAVIDLGLYNTLKEKSDQFDELLNDAVSDKKKIDTLELVLIEIINSRYGAESPQSITEKHGIFLAQKIDDNHQHFIYK